MFGCWGAVSRLTPLLWTNRAFQVLAAATCLAAMATSASAAMDAPVYTKSEDYPLPTGLGSWASVMSEILLNRVREHLPPCTSFLWIPLEPTLRCHLKLAAANDFNMHLHPVSRGQSRHSISRLTKHCTSPYYGHLSPAQVHAPSWQAHPGLGTLFSHCWEFNLLQQRKYRAVFSCADAVPLPVLLQHLIAYQGLTQQR